MEGNNSIDALSRADLETLYHNYIQCINTGDIGAHLSRFCHETPTYNGRILSRAAYQANIDAAFEHMPDTHFAVDLINIDVEQQCIAARITVTGTLVKPWQGFDTEANMVFREHVFYALRGGKIDQVWTLIKPGDSTPLEP